jgi:hypothetical protein
MVNKTNDKILNNFLTENDPHEVKAETYYKSALSNFKKTELFLKASEEYALSKEKDAGDKSNLCKVLYFREKGVAELDLDKAKKWLWKAVCEFKKNTINDKKIARSLALEFYKKKMALENKKNKRPSAETVLKVATLFNELKNKKQFHIHMSLYYMFLNMGKTDDLSPETIKNNADLMLKHARLGEEPSLVSKIEGLNHRIKSNFISNPKERLKELEKTVNALGKTDDKFGLEEAKTEHLMTQAMITVDKKKRSKMLIKVADSYHKLGSKSKENFVRQLLSPIPFKVAQIIQMAEESLGKIKILEKKLIEVQPEKGPSTIFYHIGYMQTRIEDIERILVRMAKARKTITELHILAESLEPIKTKSGKSSKKLFEIRTKSSELTKQMRQDLESLLIFGNLLLDQWSYIIGLIGGYELPINPRMSSDTYYSDFSKLFSDGQTKKELNEFWKKHKKDIPKNQPELNFAGLLNLLQSNKYSGELKVIWEKHYKDIIWLTYHLRNFRNVFIEHLRKPWQMGSTMGLYGEDFNFHIPRPVGSINSEEEKEILEEIYLLAPQRLKDMPDDYWEKKNLHRVLEVTMFFIDEISNQNDREKVWNAWHKLGGSTPSYDVIGKRLFNYISTSLDTILKITENKPELIRFGKFKQIESA